MRGEKVRTPVDLTHRGRLGFLLEDSVLYGGAAAISKSFTLITFPLLARHFSVIEYGILEYFMVLTSFLSIFLVFGQDSAVARFFYEHEEFAVRRQLISQSLVFQLVVLTVLLPTFWLAAEWIVALLIEAPDSVSLFEIVLLQLPFLLLINFSQNLLKWTFARKKFLIMSLGFTIVQGVLLVVAIQNLDVGIQGVLLISLATSALFGILGLIFVQDWLAPPKDFHYLRQMLPFAIPYGLICVMGAFTPMLERNLTNGLLGSNELGLYAAATKIAMLIGLVTSAFQTAWGPFSLSLYKQADAVHTYNCILKIFALGICILTLFLALLAQPLIHYLATDRYSGASVLVFPLAMGFAIQATSWITEIGIGISKRSYLYLYSYTLALITTLIIIWVLAPKYGLFGVGLGVLCGQTIKALTSFWLAQFAYRLPWHCKPVIFLMSMTLLLGLASSWLGLKVGLIANNLALIVSIFLVLLLGWWLLNTSERRVLLIAFKRCSICQ